MSLFGSCLHFSQASRCLLWRIKREITGIREWGVGFMSDYKLKLQQVKVEGRRPSSRTHGSQFAGGRIERRTPGEFGHCLVRECFKGLSAFLFSFFSVTLSHDFEP